MMDQRDREEESAYFEIGKQRSNVSLQDAFLSFRKRKRVRDADECMFKSRMRSSYYCSKWSSGALAASAIAAPQAWLLSAASSSTELSPILEFHTLGGTMRQNVRFFFLILCSGGIHL